ncbi:TPA: hypothetical protein DCE37_20655 [Candidatus Latescibacteria bacterium]|nr:hypothetical protein [Candidatus Latescibacterota bacterium]
MEFENNLVNYEAFGAKGDGVTDDTQAICDAHAYANEHALDVRTDPRGTYYMGGKPLTTIIATNTDWSTSRFTIDDAAGVENHRLSVFEIQSLLEPEELSFTSLTRDQRQTNVRPERNCWVRVENENKRLYLRRGRNVNQGVSQSNCFVLRRDGTIEGDIDWEYDEVTGVEALPIENETLSIRGGIFTTFASRWQRKRGTSTGIGTS